MGDRMNEKNKDKFLKRYITNKDELVLLNELEQSDTVNQRRMNIKKQQEEIENILNNVRDTKERIVLQRKYYLGETEEVIAEKINYSKSQTRRIIKKAIENLKM